MFQKLEQSLKETFPTIVFPEGPDYRIQAAAEKLSTNDIVHVILLGNPDEIKKAAEDRGYNISKCEIIDPENYDGIEEMVQTMVALRKGKMTEEQVREIINTPVHVKA